MMTVKKVNCLPDNLYAFKRIYEWNNMTAAERAAVKRTKILLPINVYQIPGGIQCPLNRGVFLCLMESKENVTYPPEIWRMKTKEVTRNVGASERISRC